MGSIATIIILLSMFGLFVAIIGIIKGSVKFLRIKGRKNSLFLLIAFFILAIIGGSLVPVESSSVNLQNAATLKVEESVISSAINEPEGSVKSLVGNQATIELDKPTINKQVEVLPSTTPNEEPTIEVEKVTETPPTPTGILKVHYIDVGQGASQLIQTPNGKTMLIDGGNNDDEQRIVNYLKKQGVTKVDILIGTHPDADHVGGIDAVVDAFKIGSIYMPKITSNTKTYESVLTSIANKNLKVSTAKSGVNLKLDDQMSVSMIAPTSTYDDANEMSAVIKLTFGSSSFLFTGDAEAKSEKDILAAGTNLKSDVLLVGHHGSNSSTSQSFLDAVNPTYAVIQVGKNSYGHPTDRILKRLTDKKIKIYRNDKQGNIVFTSDGKKIIVSSNEWNVTTGTTSTAPTITKAPKEIPKEETETKEDSTNVCYANCKAVKEAGASPIHKGDPGYSSKLDRDGDGVACE